MFQIAMNIVEQTSVGRRRRLVHRHRRPAAPDDAAVASGRRGAGAVADINTENDAALLHELTINDPRKAKELKVWINGRQP